MSVLMTLRLSGDGTKIESFDHDTLMRVVSRAKDHGLVAHQFYGSDDEILVVDEWPDEGSFQKFFEASPEIPEMMATAGMTGEPEVRFWRKLDVGDQVP